VTPAAQRDEVGRYVVARVAVDVVDLERHPFGPASAAPEPGGGKNLGPLRLPASAPHPNR